MQRLRFEVAIDSRFIELNVEVCGSLWKSYSWRKCFSVYKLPIINRFADIANNISYEIIGIILYLVLICERY